MAYKMKGSPMQRNFGIGSPIKQEKTAKAKTHMAIDFNLENKKAQNQKLAKVNKKPTSRLGRATKAFKDTSKQLAEGGKKILKKGGKFLGSKTLGVVGMLGATSATATQPGTGTHGGKKQTTYNPKTGKYE